MELEAKCIVGGDDREDDGNDVGGEDLVGEMRIGEICKWN